MSDAILEIPLNRYNKKIAASTIITLLLAITFLLDPSAEQDKGVPIKGSLSRE